MLKVSANGVHQASMMRIMPSFHAQPTTIPEKNKQTFSAAIISNKLSRLEAFLEQTLTHRVALFLTECRALSLKKRAKAKDLSDESVLGPNSDAHSINQSTHLDHIRFE